MLSDEVTRYFIVIEAGFVIISFALAFFNYFTDMARRKAKEDLGSVCCRQSAMGCFVVKRPNALDYLRRKTTEVPKVPSIADIIRAGDDMRYTSSMFDHIRPGPQEVCWVSLYTQFSNEIARPEIGQTQEAREDEMQGMGGNARYSLASARIWSRRSRGTETPTSGHVEMGSLRAPETLRADLIPCVRRLKYLYPQGTNPQDTNPQDANPQGQRSLWILDGKPCIETSREELLGLALVLGIKLKMDGRSVYGTGPFGIDLKGECSKLHWRLRLDHQNRQPDQGITTGSGYSTLFAKHMACGCLPFGQLPGNRRTLSVYIDELTLAAIQENQEIYQQNPSPLPSTLKYLSRLPEAHKSCFFYPGGPKDRMQGIHVPWPDAVAGIAFGGLVPQADSTLVRAVKFTVTGKEERDHGNNESQLYPQVALEQLINQVHNLSKERNHFGMNRAQDSSSNMTIDELPETDSSSPATTRHAGALFARYMTLLERITAIYASTMNKEPNAAAEEVYQETCKSVAKAYENARAGVNDIQYYNIMAVKDKVGQQPIVLTDCATVSLGIITAWTYRVHVLNLEIGNERTSQRTNEHVVNQDSLIDLFKLPAVLALGA